MPDNQQLKVALIGCGGIVQKAHLPCLLRHAPAVTITAIADPDADRRNTVARKAGLSPDSCYDGYDSLLQSVRPDLVVVATPHHVHVPAIKAAIAKRIPVVCEKPLVHNLDEARELADYVIAAGTPFSLVHNFLYSPGTRRAMALLRSAAPTDERPIFARAQSLFAKDAPLDPADWRSRVETGGGALNDTCYHEIYLVEAMVGSPIVAVQARISTSYHAISADDLVLLTFEHANGVVSTVTTSWAVAGAEGTFCEVHTTQRAVRVEGRGRRIRHYSRTNRHWQEEDIGPTDAAGVASGHAGFWEATLHAMQHRQALPVPARQALRQVAILDAAHRSSRNRGALITVPTEI